VLATNIETRDLYRTAEVRVNEDNGETSAAEGEKKREKPRQTSVCMRKKLRRKNRSQKKHGGRGIRGIGEETGF